MQPGRSRAQRVTDAAEAYAAAISVTSIDPVTGEPASEATITGVHLDDPSLTAVTFVGADSFAADNLAWAATEVTFDVPDDADPGDYVVHVMAGAISRGTVEFEVTEPE